MAFPFKTGGDFYNCEALNMRLHNHGADLNEYGTGTIYFNTGSNTNHSKHAVVHDGTNFKALAFVDEIATNIDFLALVSRVDDLETALGTDEKDVLDTWAEVKTFLASIKESDGDLMTMLNSKLDKNGGTITGKTYQPLVVDTSYVGITEIGIGNKGTIYSGFGYSNGYTFIGREDGGNYPKIGIRHSDGTPVYSPNNFNTIHTLLHSGNIGEYALKTDGSNKMTGGISWDNSTSSTWELIGTGNNNGIRILNTIGASSAGAPSKYAVGLLVSGYYGFCLAYDVSNKSMKINGGSEGFTDWRTIAFTDSDITGNAGSATKLQTARTIWGQSFDGTGNIEITTSGLMRSLGFTGTDNATQVGYVGRGSNSNNDIVLAASTTNGNVRILAGGNSDKSIYLNSSGNVIIGGSDAAGTSAKLYVNGATRIVDNVIIGISSSENGRLKIVGADTSASTPALYVSNSSGDPILDVRNGGNVGIGTTDPKKKLHVVGDLYVDGNIIATKEVSAGGAGQEGESGDGGAEVISQQLASGQSTYTITNTIKRSDIAVSLYEANVINGQTIWSLCLADIEVTNETITVTFGSATSVNHKLVAVG